MIKRFNISKPEKYIKDDVEKTAWKNVGTLTEFWKEDGSVSRIIEIPAISLKASVFEQKEREDGSMQNKPATRRPAQPAPKDDIPTVQYPEEEINAEDIPF